MLVSIAPWKKLIKSFRVTGVHHEVIILMVVLSSFFVILFVAKVT